MRVFLFVLFIIVEDSTRTQAEDVDQFQPAVDFNLPVPFGHIGIEGFGNPFTDLKQPIDLLELHMVPVHSSELEDIRKYVPEENIQITNWKKNKEKKIHERITIPRTKEKKPVPLPVIPDITDVNVNNANLPPYERNFPTKVTQHRVNQVERLQSPELLPEQKWNAGPGPNKLKRRYAPNLFSPDLPELTKEARTVNWTTCGDFADVGHFAPKQILYVDWLPFYTWSHEEIPPAVIHRFTHPTRKLVETYRRIFGKMTSKKINWYAPKIQMKGRNDLLHFAVNRKGLFHSLQIGDVPESIQNKNVDVPVMKTLLKVIGPYLLLIECDTSFATLMAVAGNEPTSYNEKKAQAALIGFKGIGQPAFRDLEGEKEADEYYRNQYKNKEKQSDH